MNVMPVGVKAAVYIRTACSPQPDSTAVQSAEVARVVDKYALNVVRTYRDLGVSGAAIQGREGLKQMIADIEPLGINVIIVYDLARLSRKGLTEVWALLDLFRKKGARIYVCQGDMFIDTGDRGNAILGGNALAAAGDV